MLCLVPLRHTRDTRFVSPTAGLSGADCWLQAGKATCVSVNWTLGDAQLEVLNTATGRRRESGAPSRLCKHAMFARWSRLHHKVSRGRGKVAVCFPK